MRTMAVVALLAASCSGPTSEIVLVVDTDVVNAASLRVTVVSPSGRSRVSTADLALQPPPRTLVLVHTGGDLGPIHVTFDALDPQGRALVSVSRESRELGEKQSVCREKLAHRAASPTLFFSNTRSAR